MPSVSVGVGLVAATLGRGDEVLVAEDEFNSLVLPLLAGAARSGATVRRVPFERLADELNGRTTLVAASHVRSNGGGLLALDDLVAAARTGGARLLIDTTHSVGVLPIDAARRGLDYVVCHGYKHLLCPRGVAFLRVVAAEQERLAPLTASWRSVSPCYDNYYGGDLGELAPGAARFDVSLAWHAWVGARESLRFLVSIDAGDRERHAVGLANRAAELLGVEPTGSSILGVRTAASELEVGRRLESASVKASTRAGGVRLSFHVQNDENDVDRLVEALASIAR